MKNYIFTLAKSRKTVRRFSSKHVDKENVISTLKTACQAPSGANSQPWRFIITTDPETKRKIRSACERSEKEFYEKIKGKLKDWLNKKGFSWKKSFLEEAPILILVLSEVESPYSSESVWTAIGYMLLALEEHGLNTVTYTPPVDKELMDYLAIPKGFQLETILPIGISSDGQIKEKRKSLCEVAFYNSWGNHIKNWIDNT